MLKRILLFGLTLCLLLALSGCGDVVAPSPSVPADTTEPAGTSRNTQSEAPSDTALPEQSTEPTPTEPAVTEPPATEPVRSIWGKNVRWEESEIEAPAEIPKEFFDGGTPIALAPDGRQLFFRDDSGHLPWLYDLDSGTVRELQPANAATEEILRQRLLNLYKGFVNEGEYTPDPAVETATGKELLALYFGTTPLNSLAPSYSGVTLQGDMLLFSDRTGMRNLAVDCDKAVLYAVDPMLSCMSSSSDELLCYTGGESGRRECVYCVDKQSGAERTVDFSFALPGADHVCVLGLAGLADGSICAVVWGHQEDSFCTAMGILGPDGRQESYQMGAGSGSECFYIYSANPNTVLTWGVNLHWENRYMVRRDSGEIGLLYCGLSEDRALRVERVPLAECISEGKPASLPERIKAQDKNAGSGIILIYALSDGQSVLMRFNSWELGCNALLAFRPETMETQVLSMDEEEPWPFDQYLTGNGCDRWFLFSRHKLLCLAED